MSDTIDTVDFSIDLLQAAEQWQYTKSVNIQTLLELKQAWYDANQTGFWNDWLMNIFDLRTCNDFGLVVWAIILGIPLTFIIGSQAPTVPPFGFGNDTIGGSPASGNGNFYNSNFSSSQTQQITLSSEQKRIILRLRYRQMISRGVVTETNKILADLLVPDYGPMYIVDNHNMTQTIVCVNGVPAFLRFLFTEFDLIPRPAGVSMSVQSGP